jgi:hypothetical protein
MKTICKYFSIALFFFVSIAAAQQTSAPNAAPRTANTTSNAKALVVNGQAVPGGVVQINGRTYADLLALSQLTGATITIQPDRIVIAFPNAAAPPANNAQQNRQGFSKEFARQAIAFLADVRDWRSAIEMAITVGVQESLSLEQWFQQHRRRAEEDLHLASVAASTPDDRNALQLFQNEFAFLREWDSTAAAQRQDLNADQTMDPAGLEKDPLRNKIIECGRFLGSMLSSGTFSDNAICH